MWILCLALSACGGGGSGAGGTGSGTGGAGANPGGTVPVSAEPTLPHDVLIIHFPFAHAAYNSPSVTVSGSLEHARFAEMSVTVMAEDAEKSGLIDDAGNFVVSGVPLPTRGLEAEIEVTVMHPDLGSTSRSLALSRQPDLASIRDIELDASGNRLVAIDKQAASVVSIGLSDGERFMLSSVISGSGDPLAGLRYGEPITEPVSLALDNGRNRAYVFDDVEDAVLEINLATGQRSRFFEPMFWGRIAFDDIDSTVVIAANDGSRFQLLKIDPVTGQRTQIVGPGTGAQPYIPRATALDMDPNFYRAILANGSSRDVLGMELSTGRIHQISGPHHRPSPFPVYYSDLAVHNGTAYAVDELNYRVVRIDLSTGHHSIVSDPATFNGEQIGAGPLLYGPEAIVFDEAVNRLIVADRHVGRIFSIDLDSGNRTLLSEQGVGDGIHLRSALALATTTDPFRLFAVAPRPAVGIEFDLATGERRTIFGEGSARQYGDLTPGSLAVDVERGVLYFDDFAAGAVVELEIQGGSPSLISSPTRGTGPLFGSIRDIVLDLPQRKAYVLDVWQNAIVAVDLDTGDRTIVSDSTIGVGEAFRTPVGLALGPGSERIFVSDRDRNSIYEVNLLNGDRAAVAGPDVGGGERIGSVGDIVHDARNGRLLALDTYRLRVIAIDLATGHREIVSGYDSQLAGLESADGSLRILSVPDFVGGGSAFGRPGRLEYDEDRSIAYVFDEGYNGLLAIELHNGDRQLISR